ncbi:hypothetical protein Q8G39_28360, partial [Klebsiella pneumoniae]|uniref:hypothetical protein n=1 Tax=Klebsiella pneumoniae TaxID=573 RepID=UPI003013EC1A
IHELRITKQPNYAYKKKNTNHQRKKKTNEKPPFYFLQNHQVINCCREVLKITLSSLMHLI